MEHSPQVRLRRLRELADIALRDPHPFPPLAHLRPRKRPRRPLPRRSISGQSTPLHRKSGSVPHPERTDWQPRSRACRDSSRECAPLSARGPHEREPEQRALRDRRERLGDGEMQPAAPQRAEATSHRGTCTPSATPAKSFTRMLCRRDNSARAPCFGGDRQQIADEHEQEIGSVGHHLPGARASRPLLRWLTKAGVPRSSHT